MSPPLTHMRLLALPLTKRVGSLEPLIYYYAQQPRPGPSSNSSSSGEGGTAGTAEKPSVGKRVSGLVKKGISTATRTWVGFGKKPPRSWQHRLYSAGQRIYRRIDFEELALTGLEPALGPGLLKDREGEREKAVSEAKARGERVTIPLLYPPFLPSPLTHLRTLVSHRAPSHKRSLYIYLIALPVTAPFALVPVIPNIPFFYCAWRAWSHYRAYRAANYLSKLLDSHSIVPTPSPLLEKLYATFPSLPPTLPPPSPPATELPPSSSSVSSVSSNSSGPSPSGTAAGERESTAPAKGLPNALPNPTTTPFPSSPSPSASFSPSSTSSSQAGAEADQTEDLASHYLLLNDTDILTVLKAFDLPEEGATELGIALAQARVRVREELRSLAAAEGKGEGGGKGGAEQAKEGAKDGKDDGKQ